MSTTPRTVFSVTDKILQPLPKEVGPLGGVLAASPERILNFSASGHGDRSSGGNMVSVRRASAVGDFTARARFCGRRPHENATAGRPPTHQPNSPPGRPGGAFSSARAENTAIERPRLGTVLVDLAIGATRCAEYPAGGFGFFDNDHGRYWFTLARDQAKRWQFCLGPGSREHAEAWVAEVVAEHA